MKLTAGKPISAEQVMAGFDRLATIYPHVPSTCMWRAWELAAYSRYTLCEPVLDLGCGDGALFRLVWPDIRDVTGVDQDAAAITAARQSGVYRRVIQAPAQKLPVESGSFACVFANCSMEHMDDIGQVLAEVHRCLKGGGQLLCSVVTDKFVEWNPLPPLAGLLGASPSRVDGDYRAYHHLANPLSVERWAAIFGQAGFERVEHVAILPETISRVFLFIDNLWHVSTDGSEVGTALHGYISRYPQFPQSLRHVMLGLCDLEHDFSVGSGAVFCAWRGP